MSVCVLAETAYVALKTNHIRFRNQGRCNHYTRQTLIHKCLKVIRVSPFDNILLIPGEKFSCYIRRAYQKKQEMHLISSKTEHKIKRGGKSK